MIGICSLKIASINNVQNNAHKTSNMNDKNISFKSGMGMGALGFSGALMQGIEKQGYFLSFIIQDELGMTLPRVVTGFYRDKEVTGEWNVKEGLEVLGREGLTGPFMMAVAPFMVWLTGKGCRTASTNSKLIKAIGDTFKGFINSSAFSNNIKNDKAAFKKEFNKQIWEKIYKDTIPDDMNSKEHIEYILKEFETFVTGNKRKIRNTALGNITSRLNERLINTSSKLDYIDKLSIDVNGNVQTFKADDVIKAIRNFGTDAIERNKNFKDIDATAVENITNNFAAKRLFFNIGTVAATLTGLSILPKIYAYNKVAPGATHLVKSNEEKQIKADNSENAENQENISFKGKGINSDGIISRIGKFIHEKFPNWVKNEFEYNGINFTPTLMACLSLFGLLTPRCLRAYNRAYIDENGKRDMSEINEILLRDSISSLAVVYTVPILQKWFVSSIEKKQGFVLTNRAGDRFVDKINPYSKLKLLSNSELQALYGNIDSKVKMMNFMNYINDKGGDLQKILSKSSNAKDIFTDKDFTLESIAKESAKVKNEKIISFFEKLEDNEATKELIKKLMSDAGVGKQSSIAKVARGLNSIPGFLATVVISPIILGVLIPMLTYANTRKAHAKMTSAANSQN